MLETQRVDCPYCGEPLETTVELSAGSQDYIEDCPVCCRPIEFQAQILEDSGELARLTVRRDDE